MRPRSTISSGLDVDCEAMYVLKRFADRFVDRRMRMNRAHHALDRRLGFHCRYRFPDQFKRFRPDDVYAQYLAELLVRHHFDEALMLAENRRLAVAGKRKFS